MSVKFGIMELQLKIEPKYIIIYLSGPIDARTANELEESLIRVIEFHSDKDIIINLQDVKYMSSSGLRIFISVKNNLIDSLKKLKLCCTTEAVQKVFEITRVSELFDMYSSEQTAIESL
jgi:anti-anti-sigma factor